jgi:hypothetical protein
LSVVFDQRCGAIEMLRRGCCQRLEHATPTHSFLQRGDNACRCFAPG